MTGPLTPQISWRKRPKQARAQDLVAAVLDAAIQVLKAEGTARFTTARVAERAGVSVGSLYQYFPNKEAILFRLQSEEWRRTIEQWGTILGDVAKPSDERLRNLVHAFIRSEIEEAAVRVALDDAAPLYRDAPEAREIRAEGDRIVERFMCEALPAVSDATRELVGDLIITTITAVGKEFSEASRTETEINAYADAMANMLCAYLLDCRTGAYRRRTR